MKKLLIFSFILVVSMGLVYSAGLTVNSPSGGTWYKGDTETISWTPTGTCTSSNYKINIYKNSVIVANFVEQLTANGVTSKNWTIPMGYTNGTYIIRVKAEDNSCLGDSAPFTIANTPGPGTGSITITHPTLNEEFCRGETETISWTSSGTVDSGLKINIYKTSIVPANFVTQLTAATASGSKGWAVPAGAVKGDYYLRIKTNDEEIIVDSPKFKVDDCDGGSGPGLDPDLIERLKDKLRGLQRIPWWKGPWPGPWPGPGPECTSCPVFDLARLKELLEKMGLKEQIGVALYNGGQKIADFGKFGPSPRLRKGMRMSKLSRVGMMQNRVGIKMMKTEHVQMFEKGAGFRLVFFNAMGKEIASNGILLQEQIQK